MITTLGSARRIPRSERQRRFVVPARLKPLAHRETGSPGESELPLDPPLPKGEEEMSAVCNRQSACFAGNPKLEARSPKRAAIAADHSTQLSATRRVTHRGFRNAPSLGTGP